MLQLIKTNARNFFSPPFLFKKYNFESYSIQAHWVKGAIIFKHHYESHKSYFQQRKIDDILVKMYMLSKDWVRFHLGICGAGREKNGNGE